MTPQVQTLLTHLEKHGSISQAEAGLIYKIRSLPRRISDLKELGHNITRELKKDATGQRYARYTLVPPKPLAKVGDRVKVVAPQDSFNHYDEGDVGTITDTQGDGMYIVAFDKHNEYQRQNCVFLLGQELEVIA